MSAHVKNQILNYLKKATFSISIQGILWENNGRYHDLFQHQRQLLKKIRKLICILTDRYLSKEEDFQIES